MQQPTDGVVTMYVTDWCPYCVRAKALLQNKGVPYTEINLDRNPEGRGELIRLSGGKRTVPQIFVGRHHVGGCDELYALERKAGLDPLLDAERIERR